MRRSAPLLWKVIAPAAIAVAGYFPGKRLRLLGDLPPNVMRQWARWCMHPDYLLGELPEMREEFAKVDLPMVSLSFTDDEMMSSVSISTLDGLYAAVDQVGCATRRPSSGSSAWATSDSSATTKSTCWDELILPYLAECDD